MRRPLLVLALVLLLAACASAPRDYRGETDLVEQAIGHLRANQLEEALPLLKQAVAEAPEDADAHAWLAEVQRRLGTFDEAFEHAGHAVRLDPCHAFGHTVLGDLHNPQYVGDAMHRSRDDALDHYRMAVQCDPLDGNAWLSIWVDAVKRGDTALEWEALTQLSRSGFWPPALLAHDRWILEDLPERALLITNGDADTYPTVQLQVLRDVRPDVAVVNFSLLNLESYAQAMATRHGLPLPSAFPEPYRDESGRVVSAAQQLLASWAEARAQEALDRPLTLSVTFPGRSMDAALGGGRALMGGYWLFDPAATEARVDPRAVLRSLAFVDLDALEGPMVSERDRSPVRQANGANLANNPPAAAIRAARVAQDAGERELSRELHRWAERYLEAVAPPFDFTELLKPLREAAADQR